MAPQRITILLVAAAALFVAACGSTDAAESGGSATPTPSAVPDAYTTALAALTIDDLPALVLPARNYGLLTLGMEISEQSGPSDNQEVADDFETLEVSAADIARYGRLGGYALSFENQTFEQRQIVQVDTSVQLFKDTDRIDEYFDLGFEDLRASDGIGGFELLELEPLEPFDVDGATGWTIKLVYPGWDAPVSWTFGVIRHGRLIGSASVFEFGEGNRVPEMIGVLEQLDARLRGALDGTLEVSVEHVLPATEDDRKVPAPLGGPDLAAMALTADDLGPGWRLDEDGYYADPDRLALFNRTFKYTQQGAAVIGTSEVGGLETDLQFWPSVEQAANFVASRRTLFEGEAGAANYARLVAEDDGPTVTNVATEILDLPYGDQAVAITIASDWNTLGRQTYLYIAIRSGDIVSWTTVDTGGSLSEADRDQIADLAAARLLAPPE